MLASVSLATLLGRSFRPSTPFPVITLNLVSNSWRRWSRTGRNIKLRSKFLECLPSRCFSWSAFTLFLVVCLHVVSRGLPLRCFSWSAFTLFLVVCLPKHFGICTLSDIDKDILYHSDFFVGPENILLKTLEQLVEAYDVLKHAPIHLECSDECRTRDRSSSVSFHPPCFTQSIHLSPTSFKPSRFLPMLISYVDCSSSLSL